MSLIKLYIWDIYMIVVISYSLADAHNIVLSLAVVFGIVVNMCKFYWLWNDRKKHDKWKNPSHYYAKPLKKK